MTTVLLVYALIAASPAQAATAEDLSAYDQARAAVGRDPEANIKFALWCESHGLQTERLKHLALAVMADPENASARGLLGLVAYGGRWKRPEAVAAKVKADEALTAKLAEYNRRRARTPEKADAHFALGLWCEENGLDAEAAAHFTAVTRLDPSRQLAWKRLGYKEHHGRWMTDEQIEASKIERKTQAVADRHWKSVLEKAKAARGRPSARDAADAVLDAVSDPRAVPAVWKTLANGNEAEQFKAVEIFGRIDGVPASRALVALALVGKTPEVRKRAGETLRQRDPREYLNSLIAMLRKPLKYYKPLKYQVTYLGANGLASPGVILLETPDAILRRTYTVDETLNPRLAAGLISVQAGMPMFPFDNSPFGYPGSPGPGPSPSPAGNGPQTHGAANTPNAPHAANPTANVRVQLGGNAGGFSDRVGVQNERIAEIAQSLDATNAQIFATNAQIDTANAQIAEVNDRDQSLLHALTGQDFGTDPEQWKQWWVDQQGYSYTPPKPTFDEYVEPQFKPILDTHVHFSCFAAGTPVQGLEGPKPIEQVRVGDRVLTQDTATGRLSLRPVIAVYHNRPSATLRIKTGTDSVVATGIHRFWKAGSGWVMARDLKPGDRLRTVDGTATVDSVETEKVMPVFNLEVGGGQSFFVGPRALLAHDNSLVLPATVAFDAEPELKDVVARAR